MESSNDFSSSPVSTDNTSKIRLHPDLVAVNLNLYSGETDNVTSNTKCPICPLMTDCNAMNTVVSDVLICKDNSDLTESLSRNKLQESKNEVEGEQSHVSCSVEASVCDNLVDLSSYTDEAQPTHIRQDSIVLNPDLEGLVFSTFTTASEVFSSPLKFQPQ